MIQCSGSTVMMWNVASREAGQLRHEFVEREHLLIALCESGTVLTHPDGQKFMAAFGDGVREETAAVAELFAKSGLDCEQLIHKLRQFLGTGRHAHPNHATIHRSPDCRLAFDEAAQLAQAHSLNVLNCGHLLAALVQNPGARVAQALTTAGGVTESLKSAAMELAGRVASQAQAPDGKAPEVKPKQSSTYLAYFGTDLTQMARDGKLEPMVGRKKELLQVARTLCRKTNSNPLLLGDPGVGKTAIVQGLARYIALGKAIDALGHKRIIEINTGQLLAGTKHRGELEERLTHILEETQADTDIVLFFDEIHALIGGSEAGGAIGAADLLKPALSNGQLRCIGSTTVAEYRVHIEKDPALARRFHPIMVDEPTPDDTLKILTGMKERYETYHLIKIEPDALRSAVELSCRFLPDRRLPDKALNIIDEACVRVKVGTLTLHDPLPANAKLNVVTPEVVAEVVAEWTGIPVTRLSSAEQQKLSGMREMLARRVVGQPDAIERVCQVVATSREGLRPGNRPTGVFLFLGPTGTGKTELSKALAEFLFGSEHDLIRVDMSEYMEKHNVSRLVGAPPGFIGHDEEGQLTGPLRRKPYSVVLLDEVEKAHPDIWNLFLQLFDEGRLTDTHGRLVDGRNAIFIMTSNLGAGAAEAAGGSLRAIGFVSPQEPLKKPSATERYREVLQRSFRPEFLNRIDDIVIFNPLSPETVLLITRKMFEELAERSLEHHLMLEFSEEAVAFVAQAGYDPALGARPLARAVDRLVTRPLGQQLVNGLVAAGDAVRAEVGDGGIVFRKIEPVESPEHAAAR